MLGFEADETAQAVDPTLAQLTDEVASVVRVKAWPLAATRWTGLRNQGWRGWWRLRETGNRLISEFKPDLILFSTTVFNAFFHGVYWRKRWKIPFVLDLQDPWFNEHYKNNPLEKPPGGYKYYFASAVARFGERHVYPHASGFISVSAGYFADLKRRFPTLSVPQLVLPFVPDEGDWHWVKHHRNSLATPGLETSRINIVAAGRGGRDMAPALNALLHHLSHATEIRAECSIHLIGTAYTNRERPKPQFNEEVSNWPDLDIRETPWRLPYLESLCWMMDASVNLILGSTDHRYSPSKFFNTFRAGRPVLVVAKSGTELHSLAINHPNCFVLEMREDGTTDPSVLNSLVSFLGSANDSPKTEFSIPAAQSALAATQRQAEFFKAVLADYTKTNGNT